MNYFTHVLPFLDRDPYFVAGCCLPDWLSASDRKSRPRERLAAPYTEADDRSIGQLAQGIVQHHRDDDWFHRTRTFQELSMQFTTELRHRLAERAGLRAGFLGHILIELILDALLHDGHPGKLERFYGIIQQLDSAIIKDNVNRMVTRPAVQVDRYIGLFLRERYLFDYGDDARLIYRINFVLRRVRLAAVGAEVQDWLPSARRRVSDRAAELLVEYRLQPTD